MQFQPAVGQAGDDGSCVTMMMVVPEMHFTQFAEHDFFIYGIQVAVGSSARMMCGSLIRARAMQTRCCSAAGS